MLYLDFQHLVKWMNFAVLFPYQNIFCISKLANCFLTKLDFAINHGTKIQSINLLYLQQIINSNGNVLSNWSSKHAVGFPNITL